MIPRVHATVAILAQSDVIAARHAGRELARALGFGTVDQTRLATAISELARNTLQHAGTGLCTIHEEAAPGAQTLIRVVVSDEGPGIADVAAALQPGFSTGNGLGLGLPAVQRLTDQLTIDSRPGRTVIEITMGRRR
ncbi:MULTISPECIES: anti-sigma regulatory factor [unclassified Aureimonas]|uniref:anti-sigma regulatory factor n=1 Tax=unclassified Aureimonas TaxID=2615206 RepID=UPI0006FC7854|nr:MULTISPECIES: anti-sigma regulatory factor [unclassified Aureimonas]KQT69066.1 anti-sigma regulatory factor [Aureimonas sp. Leaf460]KQT69304.1 anti-sigma regulatory factor [Aureimonas sp. Leaf427]